MAQTDFSIEKLKANIVNFAKGNRYNVSIEAPNFPIATSATRATGFNAFNPIAANLAPFAALVNCGAIALAVFAAFAEFFICVEELVANFLASLSCPSIFKSLSVGIAHLTSSGWPLYNLEIIG